MLALSACQNLDLGGTIKAEPAALKGDFSGKDFSGGYALVGAAADIPHIPESKGRRARWSQVEEDQVLFLDGHCQRELFKKLPKWAQAYAKEMGWKALAIGVGQGIFAAIAYPGIEIVRVVLAGMGYGAVIGADTARVRQDVGEKSSMATCMSYMVWDTRLRFPGNLEGTYVVPWVGNGHVPLPETKDAVTAPKLPPLRYNIPPHLQ